MSLLIFLLVLLLVMYIAYYILGLIALPEPMRTIILIVVLILILAGYFGVPGGNWSFR